MASCKICGKHEPVMLCVCSECLAEGTVGGSYLSRGMEGLIELVDRVVDASVYCRHLGKCLKAAEDGEIDEAECRKCIEAWLRSPAEQEKDRQAPRGE